MKKSEAVRLLDEGKSYAEMKELGFAPLEYKAYHAKRRKQAFIYIVIPWDDMQETIAVIDQLREENTKLKGERHVQDSRGQ
jgi:hypothetical protein